jgi:hypothetical protein
MMGGDIILCRHSLADHPEISPGKTLSDMIGQIVFGNARRRFQRLDLVMGKLQTAFSTLAIFDVCTCAHRLKEGCFNGILLFEYLHHELRLNLI